MKVTIERIVRVASLEEADRLGRADLEKDLYDAIASGKVAGAALDVYEVEPLPKDFPLRTLRPLCEVVLVMKHYLDTAEKTARAAGELLRQNFQRPLRVNSG